jgi:hypothetical protein
MKSTPINPDILKGPTSVVSKRALATAADRRAGTRATAGDVAA